MKVTNKLKDKAAAIKGFPLLATKIVIAFDGVYVGPWSKK